VQRSPTVGVREVVQAWRRDMRHAMMGRRDEGLRIPLLCRPAMKACQRPNWRLIGSSHADAASRAFCAALRLVYSSDSTAEEPIWSARSRS